MRSMTDEGRCGLVEPFPWTLIRPLLRKGHLLPRVGEGSKATTEHPPMTTGDLVALGAVKNWLGVTTDDDDALLAALISQISRGIYNYINRSFVLPTDVTEAYDGAGRDQLLLRNWPIGAVYSVVVDGNAIPPAPMMVANVHPTHGYVLEQSDDAPPGAMQQLFLRGPHVFRKGRQNVVVSYRAGYEIVGEAQAIPLSAPFTIDALAPYGGWAADTGVAYAGGGDDRGSERAGAGAIFGHRRRLHIRRGRRGRRGRVVLRLYPRRSRAMRAGMGRRPLQIQGPHWHDQQESRRPGDGRLSEQGDAGFRRAVADEFPQDHRELTARLPSPAEREKVSRRRRDG